MDMHGSLDRFGAARTKAAEGPSGKGWARTPNLSPAFFSAHDHAEGEFFSAAKENTKQARQAAKTGQEQALQIRRGTGPGHLKTGSRSGMC